MLREMTAHLTPAYFYEKSHREQSRARQHHDKNEKHSPRKILHV
jgi:hypothetical protein